MSTLAPSVVIPNTTATHVLGDAVVELGSGDLTLVPAPQNTQYDPTIKTPVLTLSVGKAAFPLHTSTVFGTDANDERVYVFEPDLGENISGYVKLTLPDGVQVDESELSTLQERFEKVLIENGLLKEGGDASRESPRRSVTIPDTTATHIIGDTNVELARGNLVLTPITTTNPGGEAQQTSQAVLNLSIGEAAFPLYKNTQFGTLADNERVYLFKPDNMDSAVKGFVKITLPEGIVGDSQLSSLQEKFEQILISFGLLKAGVEAVGDELGSSIKETGSSAAQAIRAGTVDYLLENPPTKDPATLPETAHSISASASSATQTVYSAAQSIGNTVSSLASSAGSWITARVGPVSPTTAAAINSVANAYDATATGVSAAVSDVKGATTQSVGDLVQNDLGRDVREVGGQVSESVGNVAGAVGQVAEVAPTVAVSGARGALEEENKKQEQLREQSGEWNDVPV